MIDTRSLDGLGCAELRQSGLNPSEYQGRIALNSYESNCLRDWLAHRWNSSSLEQTRISLPDGVGLIIELPIVANNILDARIQFDEWLLSVQHDRDEFHHSRK